MSEFSPYNVTSETTSYTPGNADGVFRRYEFFHSDLAISIPCLLVLGVASVVGTGGNLLILLIMGTRKDKRTAESIFIINLACSDMYVTMIADPMSIVAKLEGEDFYNSIPYLCQTIGSLCTISCVGSLMTIAMMSINRYFYICKRQLYKKIFTLRSSICMCFGVYSVGVVLVLLNLAGVGDHQFDRKSLECIFDRMATYSYTIIFSFALVWLPLVITGLCYLRLYRYVSTKAANVERVKATQPISKSNSNTTTPSHQQQLAKALFIIYTMFMVCWIPYALLIVVDVDDSFSHVIHVYITTFAHLHPSLNWLVYCLTNRKIAEAFKSFFGCRKAQASEPASTQSLSQTQTSRL